METKNETFREKWARMRNQTSQIELDIIFKFAKEKMFGSGLEIGAGDGFESQTLIKYCSSLISTEYNNERLNAIKSGSALGIKYCLADAENLPFEDSSFDFIFSSSVLEHIKDKAKCIKELRRVLKDDGVMVHIMPNRFWKILTNLFYFPFVFYILITKERREVITQKIKKDNIRNNIKNNDRTIIKKCFFPIHGEYPNHFVEFYESGKNQWINFFEKNGFYVNRVIKLVVTSGYRFGLNYIRCILMKIGLCTTYAYVVTKKGGKCDNIKYFLDKNKKDILLVNRSKFSYLLKYIKNNPFLLYCVFYKFRFLNIIYNIIETKLKLTNLNSKPYLALIENIMGCNLKCPLCPVGNGSIKRKKGIMNYFDFVKIIDEIKDYTISLSLWLYGEPLLNPETPEMIRYAVENRIHTILATNAHFLNDDISHKLIASRLSHLRISLDGASQETYSKYRKQGDYEKVIENIRNLVLLKKEMKSKMYIEIQFIVMTYNAHEIRMMNDLKRKLGFDALSFKKVTNFTYGSTLDLSPEQLKHTKREIKYPINACKVGWNTIMILYDGSCIFCCLDYENESNLGNVFQNGIYNVWGGKKMTEARKSILAKKPIIRFCNSCMELDNRFLILK